MRTLLILLVFAPALAAAQDTVIRQGAGPAPAQLPPRDPRAATSTVAGTASIRGRIFAADSGKPLRRARIQVGGAALGEGRTTSTDADGRYEVKDLPAGRYNINVTRSGYLRLSYGQRRPFELGKPFDLANGQRADNVDFTLPKMSLITGRVLDEANEPISGVRVWALRPIYFEGRRRLLPEGQPSMTDDAGQYRILGLTPGSYFVMADTRETWTVVENGIERVMGYAQTYYPGIPGVTDARRVMVGVGQEASNTDFALLPGRGATISGTVYDSQGRPAGGRQLQLGQEYRGPNQMFAMSSNAATIAGDGTFKIAGLPPGDYKLSVRSTTDINGTVVQESAAMPITIAGVDVDNLSLTTSSGWSASGSIVSDTGELVPAATATRFRVVARPVSSDGLAMGPAPAATPDNGRVTDIGTFILSGLFGATHLRVTAPDGWTVKSIQFDGRDVTDAAIEGRSGDALAGLQVVVTNKVNIVAGALTDAKGAPTSDGTVILFADDAQKWLEDSRFVRSARPDQQGTFEIKGLPPGDYLAVALEYVEDGSWNDPDFLESVRRYGQRLTLTDTAGSQTVALKLISPQ